MEDVVIVGVADAADGVPNDLFDVDDRADRLLANFRNGDFTAHDHDVAFYESFAGDPALRIDRQAGVEDGVRDGVRDFIRMALADGF